MEKAYIVSKYVKIVREAQAEAIAEIKKGHTKIFPLVYESYGRADMLYELADEKWGADPNLCRLYQNELSTLMRIERVSCDLMRGYTIETPDEKEELINYILNK